MSALAVYQFGISTILVCSRPPPFDCAIAHRFPEVQPILADERERFED